MSDHPILAVTGGTGFVGRHLVRQAAAAGWQVRALARTIQSPIDRTEWLPGSLENKASLEALCHGAEAIIHVAGIINAPTRDGFVEGNVAGTLNLIEAAKRSGTRRFINISSLAARKPDLSVYGWSKARAEALVAASGLAWTTIRPPAVYGPGDRELLELFRMAARGWVLLPPQGRLSVIAAEDLARLMLRVLGEEASLLTVYEPDDGHPQGWTHVELAQAIGAAVDRPRVHAVTVPAPLLRLAASLDQLIRGAGAKLTRDRAGYFSHPDWVARAEHRPPPQLWRPKIGTFAGLKATADWYRTEGWLRSPRQAAERFSRA